MQPVFRGLITSLLFVLVSGARAQDTAEARYNTFIKRVKKGDPTADIGELRLAFATSAEYTSDTDSDLLKEMYAALGAKNPAVAIATAEKVLKDYYVDIDAHQVLYLAYREANDAEKAKFHQNIVRGLIESILRSGDGKSEVTAYSVISTREEYIILQVKGLRPEEQSLVEGKDHQYDVMKAVNQQGGKETLYFNIDIPMAQLRRSLSK